MRLSSCRRPLRSSTTAFWISFAWRDVVPISGSLRAEALHGPADQLSAALGHDRASAFVSGHPSARRRTTRVKASPMRSTRKSPPIVQVIGCEVEPPALVRALRDGCRRSRAERRPVSQRPQCRRAGAPPQRPGAPAMLSMGSASRRLSVLALGRSRLSVRHGRTGDAHGWRPGCGARKGGQIHRVARALACVGGGRPGCLGCRAGRAKKNGAKPVWLRPVLMFHRKHAPRERAGPPALTCAGTWRRSRGARRRCRADGDGRCAGSDPRSFPSTGRSSPRCGRERTAR